VDPTHLGKNPCRARRALASGQGARWAEAAGRQVFGPARGPQHPPAATRVRAVLLQPRHELGLLLDFAALIAAASQKSEEQGLVEEWGQG